MTDLRLPPTAAGSPSPAKSGPLPRVPFSAPDECADLFEREGEPNLILLELAVAGRLDAERLRAAVATALEALPMARARRATRRAWHRRSHWEVPSASDLDPLTVAQPGASADLERRRLLDTPIPLDAAPPLRFRLLPGAADCGDRLLLAAHHALFDAIGCVGLVTAVCEAYGGSMMSPILLPQRKNDATSVDDSPGPLPTTTPGRPARIARDGAETGSASGYGVVMLSLDATATRSLAQTARLHRATVNDLLIASLARTVARWNRDRGRPAAPVRITMPINTRPPEARYSDTRNLSRLSTIDCGDPLADFADAHALLSGVAARTRAAKQDASGPAGGPAALLLGAPWLPYAARAALVPAIHTVADRYADTTMLSNLGRLPELPDLPGAGPVTGLWMAAPAPMPRGLSVSALTLRDRLHLAVRHRTAVLGPAAAEAFAALLRRTLTEPAEGVDLP